MKALFIIPILSSLLLACGSDKSKDDNTPPVKSVDLSGTWNSHTETKRIKIATKEYISSSFQEETIILDDTENGVLYNGCNSYNSAYKNQGIYGVKTDQHFYINPSDEGYKLQKDGTLVQKRTKEYDYSPGFTYESTTTLSKLSEEVEIDNGTIILKGPIEIEEYSQVCINKYTSNIGITRTITLSTRYDNSSIAFAFTFEGDITPGIYEYQYELTRKAPLPVSLTISSGASKFWTVTGSNVLSEKDVKITIIDSTEEKISGSFEITTRNDRGTYTGEFEAIF